MNTNRYVTLIAALVVSAGEWTGFFGLLSVASSAQLAAAESAVVRAPAAAPAADLPEIVVTAHRPS